MSICKIFYTDDEKRNSSLYIDELSKSFDVQYIQVVSSVDWYRQKIVQDGPSLIVQDVMLPHPDDPEGGLDVSAGLRLLEELLETITSLRIGVCVFSNRVRTDLQGAVLDMGYSNELIEVRNKMATGFDELHRELNEFYFRLNPQ